MPSPSKQKGSGFEREVAKFLTERYGSTFTRSPGSGAYTGGQNSHRRATLANNQVRSFKGDIMPPENFELLNCEAKFYAEFPFHQLVDDCTQLEGWLQQLMLAADTDDLNILFIKVNRKGRFVAVQANLPWNKECNHINYRSSKWGDWMIYSFEKFFELNSDIFKSLSKLKSKYEAKLLLEA